MTSEMNNSWCVSTLDDFLHYRCPDCDFNVKMKDKDTFVTHALTEHPVSANYLGQLMIKEEFLEDKNHPTNDDDENNMAESFEYSVDPEDAYYIAEEPISTDSTTPKKRTKFNDTALMKICEANNLWDKKNPQVRKQCWEKITLEYNTQQNTDFTKAQVVMRYKNYRLQLKMEKSNDVDDTKNPGTKIHKTVKRGNKRTKFNDDYLMMLCEKNNLSEKKYPQDRQQCWNEITQQYNDEKGTTFTKSQVNARYKNIRTELRNERLKSEENDQYSEETTNVKTESEIISTYVANIKSELEDDNMLGDNEDFSEEYKQYEAYKKSNNSQGNQKRTLFDDEVLLKICKQNKLNEKTNPLIRSQCWVDITEQYNHQQGTDFPKIKVIQRYKNYNFALKGTKVYKPVPIECKVCQKMCSSSQVLWRHMKNIHKGSECSCEICGKIFPYIDSLNRHKKIVHEPEDPSKKEQHICDLCGKVFNQKKNLKLHVDCFHHNIRGFSCHLCGRAFFGQTDVKRHIECVHEGRRDHHCHLCGKQFGIASALKRHIEVHEGIKRHKCKFCDAAFGSHTGRKKHMRRMHPTLFVEKVYRGQGCRTFVPVDQSNDKKLPDTNNTTDS